MATSNESSSTLPISCSSAAATQQVSLDVRILLSERVAERGHRDGVLQQPAQVGVMEGLSPRAAHEPLEELTIAEDGAQYPPELGIAHRAYQRLELRDQLLGRAGTGCEQVLGIPGRGRAQRVDRDPLGTAKARDGTTHPHDGADRHGRRLRRRTEVHRRNLAGAVGDLEGQVGLGGSGRTDLLGAQREDRVDLGALRRVRSRSRLSCVPTLRYDSVFRQSVAPGTDTPARAAPRTLTWAPGVTP